MPSLPKNDTASVEAAAHAKIRSDLKGRVNAEIGRVKMLIACHGSSDGVTPEKLQRVLGTLRAVSAHL